jgi:uncharacterized RDD family membrane protein YckC
MSPEPIAVKPIQYAALRLRFRALCIDMWICLGLFLVGGLVTAILLESHVGGRVAAFGVIVALILGYEPFMVARYGGTFGRRSNIRIVCASSTENLPIWRAAARSLLKQTFGLISFAFMFVTSRAQGLHDIVAGARVIIREPQIAVDADCFEPTPEPAGPTVTRIRRVFVILLYNVLLFVVLSPVAASFVSLACLDGDLCSGSESLVLLVVGGTWLVVGGAFIILGWTGRLPGCRPGISIDVL